MKHLMIRVIYCSRKYHSIRLPLLLLFLILFDWIRLFVLDNQLHMIFLMLHFLNLFGNPNMYYNFQLYLLFQLLYLLQYYNFLNYLQVMMYHQYQYFFDQIDLIVMLHNRHQYLLHRLYWPLMHLHQQLHSYLQCCLLKPSNQLLCYLNQL